MAEGSPPDESRKGYAAHRSAAPPAHARGQTGGVALGDLEVAAGTAASRTRDALAAFAREPGRSVSVQVDTGGRRFGCGLAEDTARPAASLVKVPLALAVEQAFTSGQIDPRTPVRASQLGGGAVPGALNVLESDPRFTAADVLGLSLSLSDNDCAAWLLDAVGIDAVRAMVARCGCTGTEIRLAGRPGIGPLEGETTAHDAIRLMAASAGFPRVCRAVRNVLHASRIPLGVDAGDVAIAHKTGSLSGVAHDAAVLECDAATVLIAFLSDAQHDTLVTGYEMGLCTRAVLDAWGLSVRRTGGLL